MEKIVIKHGDIELELEGSTSFIEKHLNDFYDRVGLKPHTSKSVSVHQPVKTPDPAFERDSGVSKTPKPEQEPKTGKKTKTRKITKARKKTAPVSQLQFLGHALRDMDE